jgi:hypothetical protein
MKNLLSFALLAASVIPAFAEPLVSKADLSDFTVKGREGCWTLADGVITGQSAPDKKGSNLWTKTQYKDFVLEGEFRYTNPIDSGIFLRHECDQIQLGISGSLKRDMTCSPYIAKIGKYPVEADVKGIFRDGEWNQFTITAQGSHYLVMLNGKQVLDYVSQTSIPEGPIGFQVHPGVVMKVEFRNLSVKEIKEAKAGAKDEAKEGGK